MSGSAGLEDRTPGVMDFRRREREGQLLVPFRPVPFPSPRQPCRPSLQQPSWPGEADRASDG